MKKPRTVAGRGQQINFRLHAGRYGRLAESSLSSGDSPVIRTSVNLMQNDNISYNRRCMFCGAAKLTAEHLWGQWLIKLLGGTETLRGKTFHSVSSMAKENENRVIRKGIFDNIASSLNAKRRIVCAKCNNEWMSSIETRMKRILTNPKEAIGTQSSHGLLESVELWCALKAVTYTEAIVRSHNVEPSRCQNFKNELSDIKDRIVPSSFTVSLCSFEFPYSLSNCKLNYGVTEDGQFIFILAANILRDGFLVTNLRHAPAYTKAYNAERPCFMMLGENRDWPIFHDQPLPLTWHEMDTVFYDLLGQPADYRWVT